MDELKKEIVAYWDRRAPSYTDVIEKNLAGSWGDVWADCLTARFPAGAPQETRVLDVGTGPGFYAMILAARGYRVTAVDFSGQMLAEERSRADRLERELRKNEVSESDAAVSSADVIIAMDDGEGPEDSSTETTTAATTAAAQKTKPRTGRTAAPTTAAPTEAPAPVVLTTAATAAPTTAAPTAAPTTAPPATQPAAQYDPPVNSDNEGSWSDGWD